MTLDQAKEHLLEVAASGIATRTRKYVEIQLDAGTWDALQDWKRQGAALRAAPPTTKPATLPEVIGPTTPTALSASEATAWIATSKRGSVLHLSKVDGWDVQVVAVDSRSQSATTRHHIPMPPTVLRVPRAARRHQAYDESTPDTSTRRVRPTC